jgi:hypothetical protein
MHFYILVQGYATTFITIVTRGVLRLVLFINAMRPHTSVGQFSTRDWHIQCARRILLLCFNVATEYMYYVLFSQNFGLDLKKIILQC